MGPKISAGGASGGGGLPVPADAFIREDGVITAPPGGGGGAVDSVNGQAGVVVLTGASLAAVVTLTDAATIAVNAAAGSFFRVTLGGDRTLGTPSSPADGQEMTVEVIQGTGGSFTLGFSAAYAFPASIPQPTFSTTAGQRDFVKFIYDGGESLWQCVGWVPDQNAGVVTISQGGTGQATQQGAINALAGAQTSGQYLRGNGTNVALSAIQAADLPAGTTSAQGALQLDGTGTDITFPGTQAAGAIGKPADSGHVHPAYETIPADHGLLAWTYSIDNAATTDACVAGTIYLAKLPVRYNFTATNVWFNVTVAAVGASSGSFVGLYSSSGTLLTGSSDLGALPLGFAERAFTTPQALTAGTFVWVALLVNYASTQPTLRAMLSAPGPTNNIQNLNLTAANFRSAVPAGGTTQTALLGSFTPSSNTATGALPFWFGIS